VSPHVCRHSVAVWLAETGTPMHEIAQMLGHTDTATTYRVYARYSPDHLRGAADALEIGACSSEHEGSTRKRGKQLILLVEPRGIEPLTSTMPSRVQAPKPAAKLKRKPRIRGL